MITSSRQDQVESPGTMADIEAALAAGYHVGLRRTEIERPLYVAEMLRLEPGRVSGRVSPLRSDTFEGICREIRRFVALASA